MQQLFTVSLIIAILALLLFFLLKKRQEKKLGILVGKRIYQDTAEHPGELMYATSLPLCGKPDYLREEHGEIIPVEVKTGKTPRTPYLNHTMQLMAYCLLVEEQYGKRPRGGYLVYQEKQFRIEYTKEAEQSVRSLVAEIVERKSNKREVECEHPEHHLW